MLILGLDFETTGLLPNTDRVIEIGAVLWDTERKLPLQVVNNLIKHPASDHVTLSQKTIELTHILQTDIDACGVAPTEAFQTLLNAMAPADYIVAHNGVLFDKPFFEAELARLGLSASTKPWLDTRWDVPYPGGIKERNAEKLRAFHAVVNHFPHRAVFDVIAMLEILSRYDINTVIENSKIPLVQIQAMVSFADRDQAKTRGYFWAPVSKTWNKVLKENALGKEKTEAPFEILLTKTF